MSEVVRGFVSRRKKWGNVATLVWKSSEYMKDPTPVTVLPDGVRDRMIELMSHKRNCQICNPHLRHTVCTCGLAELLRELVVG